MLALLSVSDKRNVATFARGLLELGYQILSTGGTLDALKKERIHAVKVSDYTGSPEILGGRVKTLHPRIYGGILARPDLAEDERDLRANQLEPISVVAVNLYPFRQAVASGASEAQVTEQIDIGGPTLIRAAAKNFRYVTVVVDPDDYGDVLAELKDHRQVGENSRRRLMRKAFAHTAGYDASIAEYFQAKADERFPEELSLAYQRLRPLRYGENPHQRAAFYRFHSIPSGPSVAFSDVLQGKELSYNNLLDLDSALAVLLEFRDDIASVIVKHNTPCGVAIGSELADAYRRARAVDEVSAFGGIVALSREVDGPTARALTETFLEAVIAPSYSDAALEMFAGKKNLRLLRVGSLGARPSGIEVRSISGGLLAQEIDSFVPSIEWKVATRRAPTDQEQKALSVAWRICKHVKSNAIVFASSKGMVSVGAGQTSRVDSVKIAASKGGSQLHGSAVASDAFFPFRDGIDEAARAGATCVVQPGGSVRDAEVIAAADEHGMAMVFTGVRHFRH